MHARTTKLVTVRECSHGGNKPGVIIGSAAGPKGREQGLGSSDIPPDGALLDAGARERDEPHHDVAAVVVLLQEFVNRCLGHIQARETGQSRRGSVHAPGQVEDHHHIGLGGGRDHRLSDQIGLWRVVLYRQVDCPGRRVAVRVGGNHAHIAERAHLRAISRQMLEVVAQCFRHRHATRRPGRNRGRRAQRQSVRQAALTPRLDSR